MSQINSLLAYDDCRRAFEAALADPRGARVLIGTHDMCMNMRTRMHYFRKLDREANEKTYPLDHMLHGTSIYDPYRVRIVGDEDQNFWIYVEPRDAAMVIEGLSEPHLLEDNMVDVESSEVHLIEDKTQ